MDLFQEKEKDKEDGEERKKEGKRRWKFGKLYGIQMIFWGKDFSEFQDISNYS